ncbi:hypothetical protein E2562_010755 [Oryza meyeriana var. granulata]|uniref:DUF834 domain-containing protein n=1 Tax=Oryza meyeriana var. granulata TaxID=110450 RepID=A0A6G1EW67_9ORYZ|nr:hypothetical protein E2562_010755 [Oryza meyeriana var. granulata]
MAPSLMVTEEEKGLGGAAAPAKAREERDGGGRQRWRQLLPWPLGDAGGVIRSGSGKKWTTRGHCGARGRGDRRREERKPEIGRRGAPAAP